MEVGMEEEKRIFSLLETSETSSGESKNFLDDVKESVKKLDDRKSSFLNNLFYFAFSIVIFFSLGLLKNGIMDIAILVFVIFIHELGHLIAMFLFGYKDKNILFIPLVGAIVFGKEKYPSRLKSALVSIAGPLSGILIGTIILLFYVKSRNMILNQIGITFIFINALNLLPFYPLDGGRFIEDILLYRNKYLEAIFKGGTMLLLTILFIVSKNWILTLFSVVGIFSIKYLFISFKILDKIKNDVRENYSYSGEIPESFVEKVVNVYLSIYKEVKLNAEEMARIIADIWRRIFIKEVSGIAASLMFFLYMFLFGLVLFSSALFISFEQKMPPDLSKWKVFEYEDFRVKFFGTPKKFVKEQGKGFFAIKMDLFQYNGIYLSYNVICMKLGGFFYFSKKDDINYFLKYSLKETIKRDFKFKEREYIGYREVDFKGKGNDIYIKGRAIDMKSKKTDSSCFRRG
jgi:Zn-dependent protease